MWVSGSRPFILIPSLRRIQFDKEETLADAGGGRDSTILFANRERCLARFAPLLHQSVECACFRVARVTARSKMTTNAPKFRRGGGLLVEPWILPCPLRGQEVYSAGFLGALRRMIPFSITVILRPNTSRKIRSIGVSNGGLRRAITPYTIFGGARRKSCVFRRGPPGWVKSQACQSRGL